MERYVKTYGSLDVRGPVVRINDKRCSNGVTWRDELFIHSSYIWTDARYASLGCIKVSNSGYTGAYSNPQNVTGHISEVYARSDNRINNLYVYDYGLT